MADVNEYKVETKELSQVLREVTFIIPKGETLKEEQRIIDEFSKKAKVKGFRKGKIPPDIIRGRFKKEIEEELVEHIIAEEVGKYFKDKDIRMVARPVLKKSDYSLGSQLIFIIEYEIFPEFDVVGHDSLKVDPEKVRVKPEDIEAELEELRFRAAESIPVETRGIDLGDACILNGTYQFAGEADHNHQHPIKSFHYLVPVDNKDLSNFDRQIIGLKKGEEKTFEIKMDNKRLGKSLENKTLKFTIKIEDIRFIKLPEINDDFAKSVGEFETLKDLKADIEDYLEKAMINKERTRLTNKMFEMLRQRNKFELPKYLVEDEIKMMLNDAVLQTVDSGYDIRFDKINWEEMREKTRPTAESNIARFILVNNIADKAGISVSDQELDDEIKKIAAERRQNPVKLKDTLEHNNGLKLIRYDILYRKTVDFLLEINHIKVG